MIVGARAKQALRAGLATSGFTYVDSDIEWKPKLFLFLDSSLIESSTRYDFADADRCGINEVREVKAFDSFYLYACSIADDDDPTAYEIELEVAAFTASVLKLVAADTSLGISIPGVRAVSTSVLSNETSTRQMQAGAGGQMFNACRAVLEFEVEAWITPAQLTTTT